MCSTATTGDDSSKKLFIILIFVNLDSYIFLLAVRYIVLEKSLVFNIYFYLVSYPQEKNLVSEGWRLLPNNSLFQPSKWTQFKN